jgi:hypothetical protein
MESHISPLVEKEGFSLPMADSNPAKASPDLLNTNLKAAKKDKYQDCSPAIKRFLYFAEPMETPSIISTNVLHFIS